VADKASKPSFKENPITLTGLSAVVGIVVRGNFGQGEKVESWEGIEHPSFP
jgi:hypothetical protein